MANLKFLRGEYSKYLELVADEKVVATNLYFTTPDETPNEDDPKSSSFCLFHGTQLLACATHEADLNKAIADIKGLEVDLAALEGRIDKISSELSTYEIRKVADVTALGTNVKEAYALYKITPTVGEDGQTTNVEEQVGDYVKVYKDSALQKVELKDQTLQFTYLTVDGEEEVIEVDVTTFLAESEFADGLQVSTDGVVSVKLAENTTDDKGTVVAKNFLEFEGTEGNKSLAVRSIDTNKTVLQKELKVAGLDSQFGAGNYNNNDVIPAGTDIYTILENILCKELYPLSSEIGYQSASASASMSALTLTLDKSGTSSAPVEVGTLVTLTVGKTNGTSPTSVKSSIINNLTYGYSATDDDEADSTDTAIVSQVTTGISSNQYTIKATLTGFNADTVTNKQTVPTQVSGTGEAALAETKLGCCVEGSNTVKLYATGATYSYKADAIPSGYTVSNLGKTDSAQTYNAVAKVDKVTSAPTKSGETTVTAAYKYFMGGSQLQDPTLKDDENNFLLNSAAIRALTKSGFMTKDGTTSISSWQSPGYSVVIACPTKYKLATIKDSMGNSYLGKFSKTAVIPVQTGSITTNYNVYMYPLENDDKMDFTGITFTKA